MLSEYFSSELNRKKQKRWTQNQENLHISSDENV